MADLKQVKEIIVEWNTEYECYVTRYILKPIVPYNDTMGCPAPVSVRFSNLKTRSINISFDEL